MEKRLYRSKKESMIAGVCGGIAEYFGIDPVLIRLLFVIAVLFHGTGLLAYIILWIVVPMDKSYVDGTQPANGGEAPKTDPETGEPVPDIPQTSTDASGENKREQRTKLGAYLLIALGLVFLVDNLVPYFHMGDYWPVILIAIGGGILYKATKKNNGEVV